MAEKVLRLNRLEAFMQLTHLFRRVKRTGIPHPEGGGGENDAEHACQLTLVAWFVVEAMELPLDITKVLMYSIAHDLVEAYAGDVCCHKPDALKKVREHAAAMLIKSDFPEFPTLHEIIAAYEDRADAESKFVWALDKLVPIINIKISKQPEWKNHKVTIESLLKLKDPQVNSAEVLRAPYAELVDFLKAHPELFAH
jgi:5'-deoxynucleotidase YfbR-like HD superfamily hydrolase